MNATNPSSDTILLMLSGGIDSAFLLYDYLLNSSHPLHVHHISIRYPQLDRWRAEDPACDRIVEWCRAVRPFDYTRSRFDMESAKRPGWDSDLQLLVAQKVALNLDAEDVTVVLGWCTDDLQHPRVRDRYDRGVTPALWRALCESVYGPSGPRRELAMPLLERGLSKRDLVKALPSELLALTWSCRRPVFTDGEPLPCRRCHACVARMAATGERIDLGA